MIERLLPLGVVAVEAFADDPHEAVFPGEEDYVVKAVQSRRLEFITARRCAREALRLLGHAPAPIHSCPRREPMWPAGAVGSITHCAGYRAAAVAPVDMLDALGIDAEPHEPLPEGVAGSVTVPGEPEMLAALARDHPLLHWDRLLFSAKESVYKAWFPLTRRWLGFEDARLTIDAATGTFAARLLLDGTRVDGGPPMTVLTGRYLFDGGLVVSALSVPGEQPCGVCEAGGGGDRDAGAARLKRCRRLKSLAAHPL